MEQHIRYRGIVVTALFAVAALATVSHRVPISAFAHIGFEVVTSTTVSAGKTAPSSASATNAPAAGTTGSSATAVSGTQSIGFAAVTPIPTATSTGGGDDSDNTIWYIVGTVLVAIIVGFFARQYLAGLRK